MTIPIKPGPWSFLQTLGEGVGKTLEAKKKYEDTERAKASTDLMSMLDLYSKGVLKKLDTDVIVALGQKAGIGDFLTGNVVPKPANDLAQGQSDALGVVLPQIMASEDPFAQQQLARGTIATEPEKAKAREETARSGIRAGVMEGGGAPARRVAEVPTEQIAVAAESAVTDPFYGNVAERSVDATMTTLKVTEINPENISGVSDQAWQLAQRDARSRGFTLDEELTRPYVDAAVQSRLRQQEERTLKAQRQSGAMMSDMANYYQRQQQRVQDDIKALPVPGTVTTAMAGSIDRIARETKRSVQQVLDDPNTPPGAKKAYVAVQTYDKTLAMLQAERRAIGDNITQYLGQKIGVPDPSAVPAPSERRGGPGPSFDSPKAPDAQGNQLKAKKLARYRELVAEETRKPPAQRRPQADLMAQVEQEMAAPAIDLQTFGKDNKPISQKEPELDPRKMARQPSDTPTRTVR